MYKHPKTPRGRRGYIRTGRRKPVQATLDPAHRDDVQVLGPAVVAAVHHRGHGQTEGHAVLVALGTGAPWHTREWTRRDSYTAARRHKTGENGRVKRVTGTKKSDVKKGSWGDCTRLLHNFGEKAPPIAHPGSGGYAAVDREDRNCGDGRFNLGEGGGNGKATVRCGVKALWRRGVALRGLPQEDVYSLL